MKKVIVIIKDLDRSASFSIVAHIYAENISVSY